jgi:hypothetical protein
MLAAVAACIPSATGGFSSESLGHIRPAANVKVVLAQVIKMTQWVGIFTPSREYRDSEDQLL